MSSIISRIISRPVPKETDEEKAEREAMETLRSFRRTRVASRQLPSQPDRD